MELDSEGKRELELSERHRALQTFCRDFAKAELQPIMAQIDLTDEIPEGLIKKLGSVGLLGIATPKEYGGAADNYVGIMIEDETLTRYSGELGHSLTCLQNLTVSDTINLLGTDEQRKRWLPGLVTGERYGAALYSEPHSGSDVLAMETKAVQDGDAWLITGSKDFGSLMDEANTVLTFAATQFQSGRLTGLTAFILELDKNRDGLQLTKNDKMGGRGNHEFDVEFVNYRVPSQNILGKPHEGIKVVMTALGKQRPLAAASSVGHVWLALDASVPYAKKRVTFGKPIAERQLIQTMLVDMYVMGMASRYLVHSAARIAWELYHVRNGEDKALRYDLNKVGSAAKLLASRAARKAVLDAYQIHGGSAYFTKHPVNRILRDGLVGSQAGGTDEMMITNIAEELLRG